MFTSAMLTPLGTLGAVAFLASTLFLVFVNRRQILQISIGAWPILLLPTIAVASVLWSAQPSLSVRIGLEYALTVLAATIIAARTPPKTLIHLLCAVCTVVLLLNLPAAIGDLAKRHSAQGLYGSKNALGSICAVQVIASLATFFGRSTPPRMKAFAAVGIVLGGPLLFAANSAGAIICTTIAVAVLIATSTLSTKSANARVLAVVFAGLLVTGGVVAAKPIGDAYDYIQTEVFKKDRTLTGRSYLWAKADELARERPVLGYGYQSFWVQGQTDAEGLWRFGGIKDRTGFNFHNEIREMRIQLGFVGLAAFFFAIFWALVPSALTLLGSSERVRAFSGATFALVCYFTVRMNAESALAYPFAFDTLVFSFAVAALIFSRKRQPTS